MEAKKRFDAITRYDMPYLARLGKVRLDRNERPHPWPTEVWEELRKTITPDLIMSYPELEPLYKKLAEVLNIKRERLLLSHGSDAALKSIFEIYIDSGDEAVLVTPSYAMYPVYALMVGAKPVEVGYEKDLSLPFEKIVDAISARTKIVCLPNPNQPIERVFTRDELKTMMKLSREKDFIFVVDEAYHYFYPETVVGDIDDNPNLIVTRSFSKAFGIAGLRAGLLISNEERISDLKKVKPISEINNVAAALIEFFLDRIDIVRSNVNDIALGRTTVKGRAGKLGIPTHGGAGNSILLEFESAQKVKDIVEKAGRQGYLIRGPFPYPAVRHLRITLGPERMMNAVMDIIEKEMR